MSVYVSSLLTATAATVNADPASTRTWQWQRNGVNIPGATNSTYSAAVADIGSNLFVVQTETNFLGSNNASASVGPVIAFSPIALFQDGSQGWWYDDDDLTTLFQDSAGTTPVTAVEQFVGLQLDKSKGLVKTNIAPNSGTSLSGWTVTTTNGGSVTSTASGILLVIDGSGTQFAGISVAGTAGIFYEITATVEVVAGQVVLQTGVNVSSFSVGTTTRTVILYSSNGQTEFKRANSTIATTAYIRSISIRELPGNHRYAPASGNRPIWSKRVNLLTKTEQFDDAVWSKTNATVTANATTAPDGTATADLAIPNTSNVEHYIGLTSVSGAPTGVYKYSVCVKNGGYRYVFFYRARSGSNSFNNVFDLQTGAWVQAGTEQTDHFVLSLGDGWFRIGFNGKADGNNGYLIQPSPYSSGNNLQVYAGDGTSGVYIWGADFRPSNQVSGLPLYQRVNTSTDYDTNGFPGYLKADGVDDFLQTNSIDFTATDKITLCAGVRKLSDAARAMVTELGTDVPQSFQFNAPPAASTSYSFASRGSALASAAVYSNSAVAAPITNVATGIGDISGDSAILRINGTQVATSSTDQGTGNYGNLVTYFFRRAGTSLPFNGYEYGNIAVGKLLTADQLTALETYMNDLTKAY